LSYLERLTNEKWPFEQFRKALEDPGMEGTKPDARWQMLNGSLNAIKRGCDHSRTNGDYSSDRLELDAPTLLTWIDEHKSDF
jgi:hypothetical protein